jgi:hypothetical protein
MPGRAFLVPRCIAKNFPADHELMTVQIVLRVRCSFLADVCFNISTWFLAETGIYLTDRSWRQHIYPPHKNATTLQTSLLTNQIHSPIYSTLFTLNYIYRIVVFTFYLLFVHLIRLLIARIMHDEYSTPLNFMLCSPVQSINPFKPSGNYMSHLLL